MNTKGQTRPPGQQTKFARGQQNGEKLTILYERLSVEDERCNEESNSIKNQKALLEDYAKKQGFRNIVHITEMITSRLIQLHVSGAKVKPPKNPLFKAFFGG